MNLSEVEKEAVLFFLEVFWKVSGTDILFATNVIVPNLAAISNSLSHSMLGSKAYILWKAMHTGQ